MAVALWTRSAEASVPSPYAEGNAYDSATGTLLYREHHLCDAGRSRCTVLYRDASGALLARKELDYSGSHISPTLLMTNYRSNTEIRVAADSRNGVVVDAGFDNFIRHHWDTLENGEAVEFSFRVAGYDSPLEMVITASDDDKCTTGELCLQVDASSWLIRTLTDPIELYYSRADRTLLRYRGISNLKAEDGGAMQVEIVHTYGNPPVSTLPPDSAPRRF